MDPIARLLGVVPVEVHVEGTWVPGVLQTWTQGHEAWHGWVSYMADGDWAGDWFAAENVRRTIQNEPGQS